jgi:hypothetical protein
MTIWKWVFKIAIQIIPILLGIDWGRPKDGDKLLNFKPKRKKKNYFDFY